MVLVRTIWLRYGLLPALCLFVSVSQVRATEPALLSFAASDSLSVKEIDTRLSGIAADSLVSQREGSLLLELLSLAGSNLSTEDERIVKRHVARVIPMLPDSLKDKVARNRHRSDLDRWELRSGAGQLLSAWWKEQDPMPASDRNERLQEHIRRVSRAIAEFAADTPAGYDDRGEILVRLGEPFQRREISYNDGRMIREVFRFGVPISLSDFPDNEIWTYPHIHRNAYYIFVSENRGPYRIGTSEDLLPRRLRVLNTGSPRNMNLSVSSLAAMRYILERLALIHSDFGTQYANIDNYAMWQEERRMARCAGAGLQMGELEQNVGVGATSVAVYSNPLLSIHPVNEFVRASLTETRISDMQSERSREEVVPGVYSTVFQEQDLDRIPIAVRATRFRNVDGSTRLYIDWAPMPGALNKDEDRLQTLENSGFDLYDETILSLTVLQVTSNHESMTVDQDTFALLSGNIEGKVIPPQTVQMPLADAGNRLAVQLDHYVASIREGPPLNVLLGPLIQVGLERTEPIMPLRSDPEELEMSDLRPRFTLFTASALARTDDPVAQAQPFPYSFVPSQGSIILQFEIYNLTFDADDLTRYLIEYEVARRDPQRGILGIIGRRSLERTAARTTHEGYDRTAREYIVLDPAPWSQESEVVLTVRVTDAVAERTVERSLVFRE